ncbi:hypothetical protein PFDG_01016 [Plasmodium falciparum Dd2]|uniref:Rifin n=1 Tax=Plasmodium falciparum (isolate Dd2) TaxID=57267 RepID=A0A0L7LZ13_PLAF4|nr:hypothetical protein PFDG_01016 [Plasmodium falciparum Dd2]
MKIHYINILLFPLKLNILIYNQRNHKSTTHHTLKIPITRLLCECELYTPANYDNDPQMKEVMDNFNRQTQQRFHEYDERMVEKRMQCKDKCDKEIQKIILKDKLEKQMEQQLTTLETKITTDDIPTCLCEKSVADKMEKTCLRCAGVLGGGVMPGMGLIDGSLLGAISVLKPAAIIGAKDAALAEATALATQAGIEAVKLKIKELLASFTVKEGLVDLLPIVNESTFNNGRVLVESAKQLIGKLCMSDNGGYTSFYNTAIHTKSGTLYVGNFGKIGSNAYNAEFALQKEALETAKVGAVESTYGSCQTAIIASTVAIVIIVLIMTFLFFNKSYIC